MLQSVSKHCDARGCLPGWGVVAGVLTVCSVTQLLATSSQGSRPSISFEKQVKPLLARYCYDCHGEKRKGDLDLRVYADEASASHDRAIFEKLLKNLSAHEMPPEKKPQPSQAERELITSWVTSVYFPCDCEHPDPGRVTVRRLNRVEYNNTIRDLTGLSMMPADDFPEDDSGYGFDNNSDVLSLSPVLLEKYLSAAEKIVDAMFSSTNRSSRLVAHLTRMMPDGKAHSRQAAEERADARKGVSQFARRAFRRPAAEAEIGRLMALYDQEREAGETFESALKAPLEAVLVSSRFLFREEPSAKSAGRRAVSLKGQGACDIDDYALASRLSYFLWSSMPDDQLFKEAEAHALRRHLDAEVRRMINDPKAKAFVQNFAGQWLQLRNLKLASPDHKLFPEFGEILRSDMQSETELFFEYVLKENRSVLDLVNADYSFLNERLAKLYGVEGVEGDTFRRVNLIGTRRGGLLTQASVLTLTSNPTRTSPVKRGKWVLENILGSPPPPPPPDVPELNEEAAAVKSGSLRKRMEAHRANPTCASCHARMDPIGFGFENFDAIGAWRDKDGEFAIDAAGQLGEGMSFEGAADLKRLLVEKNRDEFVRCLAEKVLIYALGRGLVYYDKCAVDAIVKATVKEGYRFSALIAAVTKSVPFQKMRDPEDSPGQGRLRYAERK